MKRSQTTLIALSILALIFACKKGKNTEQPPQEETPLKTIVDRKAPADTIYQVNATLANYGLKFHSTINGKIKKLGCRMPAAGTYTLSLWDFSSHNLLAQAQVTITNTNDFAYTAITPGDISDINNYVVSVNSTSGGSVKPYYQLFKKPTPTMSIYPMAVGKIVIDEPLYKAGANAFPDYNNASDFPYLRGLADIVFVEGSL